MLTLGTGLAQLINIGSAPFLSRLYSPKDFGILAIFLAIVGISSTLVTLRYETAILIPKSKKESANIVAMSIFLAVVGSVLLMLISLVLSDTMLEYFWISEIKYWLPIIFIVAGLSAIITTIQSWLNREKKYFNIIAIRIAQNTFIVAISIICFYFGSMSGLILSQIISLSLTFIIALYFIRNLTEFIDLNKIKINFKTYSNAPKYLLPTAILDTISIQLPILMIASLFGERIT
ncbi:MAG: lipopolysaccharide biosynthesis protein, partial [Alphaproteobacteria bacterium]